MSKTRQDFWQWMYNCPVDHKLENDGGLEMTLTFFFEEEKQESIDKIVRATIIALNETDMLKRWPDYEELQVIIGYTMEIESARIEEEEYNEH